MSEPDPKPDALKNFKDRLRAARSKKEGNHNERSPANLGVALRFLTELVAGILVGGVLGWLLDRLFGTAPFLLIALLFAGAIAGLFNVQRAARDLNQKMASRDDAEPRD